MTWLTDDAMAHLRDVGEWPDAGERYEIQGRLGRGGMGVVYAAQDRVLAREVAIKVLDHAPSAADAPRVLREARVLAQLEHPGIVPVHDAGVLADGRVFYVMKRVRGERLDAAVQPRSLSERLDLFVRVCDAVAFAHARGVVHRDLKPENVMLGEFGEVLVMDWGAHAHEHDPGSSDSAIVGTPGFMPPEQREGIAGADRRADVYALGVMLEWLLPAPSPKPLLAIARRASAERIEARYESVQDLAREVVRYRDGEPVAAYRETAGERLMRVYRRYELPILLVAAYIAMRVALLAWRGV